MEKANLNNFFDKERVQGETSREVKDLMDMDLEWDEAIEKKYRKAKEEAKSIFWNEVQSSSFDNVGVMHIIQNLTQEQKKKKDRVILLEKYSDGQELSPEEMKFLCDTSKLLNACLDKNYIQRATRLLEEKMINYVSNP